MRETSTLEFKLKPSKSYLKTVSAFANYGTGRIVFGAADDGTPVGLENPTATCLAIENAINDTLSPVPRFELSIDEAQRTATLTVYEGEAKPYLYAGRAYRRADASTVEVGRLEYNRLARIGENTTYDALDAATQTLRFTELERELVAKLGISGLDANALVSLELRSAAGIFNNAAALLADRNDFAGVDVARFGESINIILTRRNFEKMSVLEQMEHALAVFDEYYSYEEIIGAERLRRSLVPREAFREALANALVHRRWDVQAGIKVSMFPDRIELTSPGSLPEGITQEEYLAGGPSVARNPILANVFYRLGYIERFGTGVPRIRSAYEGKDVAPTFTVRAGSITVVLPVEGSSALTADERRLLSLMEGGVAIRRASLAEMSGMSKDKTIRVLNSLLEKGLVAKSGAGRAVAYARR